MSARQHRQGPASTFEHDLELCFQWGITRLSTHSLTKSVPPSLVKLASGHQPLKDLLDMCEASNSADGAGVQTAPDAIHFVVPIWGRHALSNYNSVRMFSKAREIARPGTLLASTGQPRELSHKLRLPRLPDLSAALPDGAGRRCVWCSRCAYGGANTSGQARKTR